MKADMHAPLAPLIQAKRVPLWLVFRDFALTAIAWLAIAQSMRQGIYLLIDYVSPPVFELTHAKVPNVLDLWTPLRGFVLVAFWLVVWLVFWAVRGTRRIRTAQVVSQPAPLSIREHARYLSLKEDDLACWKTYRIAVVVFDSDNQIADVSRHDLAPTVAAATG
jgi:poly-beta-1,6-N-acetyl-D-glucosamine biosynthesis protein PgaD